MKAGNWFRFAANAADPAVADIFVIDFIGDWYDDAANRFWGENIGITARAFVESLAALPAAVKTINVHINSPGGDVQAGVNIANALRAEQAKGRTVITHIDGVAASIASVIAMAGSRVVMADNALFMVHDPMSIAVGNEAEFQRVMAFLGTAKDQIVATYKWHATISEDEIRALMTAETWMNADEALAAGFVTEKVEGLQAAATLSKTSIAKLKVPEQYRDRVSAWVQPAETRPADNSAPALDVLRVCREADCLDLAEGLVAERLTLPQVEARVTAEKAIRATAKQRATDIRAACALAKAPELADGYIAGAMALTAVKAHLAVITAKLDKVEIDGALPVDAKGARERASASWDAVFKHMTPATPAAH